MGVTVPGSLLCRRRREQGGRGGGRWRGFAGFLGREEFLGRPCTKGGGEGAEGDWVFRTVRGVKGASGL